MYGDRLRCEAFCHVSCQELSDQEIYGVCRKIIIKCLGIYMYEQWIYMYVDIFICMRLTDLL